jgi:hypothetical protein
MAVSISDNVIKRQAYAYVLVLFLWPLFLFLMPAVIFYSGVLGFLFLVFPGLYIFTWVGYLMHESWHKYVPNVNNGFFYNIFSVMLLTDPQLYSMIHGSHHSQVHTYRDAEFHPMGEIRTKWIRVVYNWMEILFGVAFLVVIASITVPRDARFAQKYKRWKLFLSLCAWIIFFGGIGYLSHLVFHIPGWQVLIWNLANIWLDSFFLHQSQLVEHGNLIVEGEFKQRNVRTRNLSHHGFWERIFLFLTHNDSREHVLHHTMTNLHTRLFPGKIALPEQATIITFKEYINILDTMAKGDVLYENKSMAENQA